MTNDPLPWHWPVSGDQDPERRHLENWWIFYWDIPLRLLPPPKLPAFKSLKKTKQNKTQKNKIESPSTHSPSREHAWVFPFPLFFSHSCASPKLWGTPLDLQPGQQWAVAADPGLTPWTCLQGLYFSGFSVSWQQPCLDSLLSCNFSRVKAAWSSLLCSRLIINNWVWLLVIGCVSSLLSRYSHIYILKFRQTLSSLCMSYSCLYSPALTYLVQSIPALWLIYSLLWTC